MRFEPEFLTQSRQGREDKQNSISPLMRYAS